MQEGKLLLSKYRLWVQALFSGGFKGHFGQYAEDVIARKYFSDRKVPGRYLDIGAFHPFCFSNTAHFYLSGWRGINIDANPNTIELFKRYRPRDRNLWSAVISRAQVSQGVTEVKLQIPDQGQAHGVSARGFVENAEQLAGHSDPLIQMIPVPATTIDAILDAEDVAEIDLLNIDVEGLDATILDEFDFTRCRPRLIIIEDFALRFEDLMRSRATVRLNAEGYRLLARVGWSSIFVLD